MSSPHTIILDGFLGRPARWAPLRRRIEQRVGSASLFHYDMIGRLSLPALGEKLITEIRKHGDRGVNVVGYSMGGLVIRSAHLVDPTLPLRKAVFMNSPHRGTWLACLFPTPGVRQMRPFDAHIKNITTSAAGWTIPTMTVWNSFDGVILPGRNTRWDGVACEHVQCAVPMHVWPVWSRTIHRRVAEFLAADVTPNGCPAEGMATA